MGETDDVLILGIGNILWADEGFGVRVVETLARRYRFPSHVRLMDGGTQGIHLLGPVEAADVLVIFDAVDFGEPPGTLHWAEDEAVPAFLGRAKMSLHQTGFQEVLAMARLLGRSPRRQLLVGVQPDRLDDYGGSLTPTVKACIDPAIDKALSWLEGLGVRPVAAAGDGDEPTSPIALEPYEAGRPDERVAPRLGDARILSHPGFRFDPKPLDGAGDLLSVDLGPRRSD